MGFASYIFSMLNIISWVKQVIKQFGLGIWEMSVGTVLNTLIKHLPFSAQSSFEFDSILPDGSNGCIYTHSEEHMTLQTN